MHNIDPGLETDLQPTVGQSRQLCVNYLITTYEQSSNIYRQDGYKVRGSPRGCTLRLTSSTKRKNNLMVHLNRVHATMAKKLDLNLGESPRATTKPADYYRTCRRGHTPMLQTAMTDSSTSSDEQVAIQEEGDEQGDTPRVPRDNGGLSSIPNQRETLQTHRTATRSTT